MAARTSSQVGNWSDTATWGGSSVPGDGDTATVNHAVTCTTNTTIGTDAAGAVLTGTGTITINSGVTFVLKGWAYSSPNLSVVCDAGSTFSFYGATSGHFANFRKFTCNGTSGSHVTVNTTGGANYGFFYGGAHNVCEMNCTYADFSGIGSETFRNQCGSPFVLSHCTFANCTKFYHTGSTATDALTVDDNDWTTPRDSISELRVVGLVAPTGGTARSVSRNSFTHNIELFGDLTDLIVEGNLIDAATVVLEFGQPGTTTTVGNIARCKNNVIVGAAWSDNVIYNFCTGPFYRNLFHVLGGSGHIGNRQTSAGTVEIYQNVFETGVDSDTGTCIATPNDALQPAVTVDCHNNIQLPSPGGANAQSFLIQEGVPKNLTIKVDHNNLASGVTIGSYTGAANYGLRAGMLSSMRSNLLVSPTGNPKFLLEQGPQYRTARIGASADVFDKGTLTGSSGTTFTDSTASWGTVFTDVSGCYIIFTSGAASGLATAITSNASGTVGNVASWAGGVTPGNDPYIIVQANLYSAANVGNNCVLGGLATGTIHRLDNTDVTSVQNYEGHYIASGSPGSGDLWATDPTKVDATRCLATYDTAATGLNNAASTGWVTATSYVVGDNVSSATSTFYGNATINYRCKVAHTSGASTKPGSGASWRTNWEFKTVYRIRSDRTIIDAMITWIQAGQAPTEALLRDAGHDSVTIGAVEGQFPLVSTGGDSLGSISSTALNDLYQ